MTPSDLRKVLDDHLLWRQGRGGARAYLARAYLAGAGGARWGAIGPVGQGHRMVTAWAHKSLSEPMIGGGCFLGTFAEFRATVTADELPWDWRRGTPEQVAQWRRECLAAADLLELAVTGGAS